jgi:hypothetical protein
MRAETMKGKTRVGDVTTAEVDTATEAGCTLLIKEINLEGNGRRPKTK